MKKYEKIRVLIAEDNIVIRETIQKSLTKIGFDTVAVANNGTEAVKMAATIRPDVILMDIEMPELNGLEATRQIQKLNPVPVVVLTAHEDHDLIAKASEVGVSAYLVKPPQTKEIERAIIMALARHDDLMKCWQLNRELQQALTEIKALRGILPLCSFCKKIRDDDGYWEQVDVYIQQHSNADISHSICPECAQKHYPNIEDK